MVMTLADIPLDDSPLAEAWVIRHHEHIVALARALHYITKAEPIYTDSGPARRKRWMATSYTLADPEMPIRIVGDSEGEKSVTVVSTVASGGGTIYLTPQASTSAASSLTLPPGAQWSIDTHYSVWAWTSSPPVTLSVEIEVEE